MGTPDLFRVRGGRVFGRKEETTWRFLEVEEGKGKEAVM